MDRILTAVLVLKGFNALRVSGAAPNFAPNSDGEEAAAELYREILSTAGMHYDEFRAVVRAHIANPVHNPAFPLPWPSPGHLLAYRAPRVPSVNTEKAAQWFNSLVTAACDARAVPRGGKSVDEVFAARAKRQLGHPLEDLPSAVLAALNQIGGRTVLADEGAEEESRGFLRRQFLKAVAEAEERERINPPALTTPKPSEPAPLLLTDTADPLPPIDFTERVRAMRERLANRRETS